MDALELLKSDHDKVRSLFTQAKALDSIREKKRLFQKIDEELSTHSHIEETVFYPAFSRYEELRSLIEIHNQEHAQLDQLLMDIENLEQHSPEIATKIDQLIGVVSRHLEREENELFPQIRKIMKRPEREILGRHLLAAKQERAAA